MVPLLCVAGPGFEPARIQRRTRFMIHQHGAATSRTTLETLQSLSGRLLIEEHPVDTELTDRIGKGRELYRLAHVTIRAELVAPQHVFVLARGRKNDDRDGFRAWIGAHVLKHVEST